MENRWIKAATLLPPTLRVCGKRLLPFCLRHRVALESINSPVLNPEAKVTPRDLLFAVRILSTHDMTETRKPMSFKESYLLALYSVNQAKFLSEILKLMTYFNAQSLWPRFWEADNKSAPSSIPWPLVVIASLVRNGCSLAEAWSMPESEAVWLHIAHSKANGAKVEVVSDFEWDAMQKYRAEEAKNQKQPPSRN